MALRWIGWPRSGRTPRRILHDSGRVDDEAGGNGIGNRGNGIGNSGSGVSAGARIGWRGRRGQRAADHPTPPEPPLVPTPWHALNPDTDEATLWWIARQVPALRRWLVANPAASPELLEYVAQLGGPGVAEAFDVLFAGLEGA